MWSATSAAPSSPRPVTTSRWRTWPPWPRPTSTSSQAAKPRGSGGVAQAVPPAGPGCIGGGRPDETSARIQHGGPLQAASGRCQPDAPPPTATSHGQQPRQQFSWSEAGCARQPPGGLPCTESPAGVAQLAEQPSCKRQVSGSNPLTGSQVSTACTNSRSDTDSVCAAKSAANCWRPCHSRIALAAASIAARSISGSTCV